MTLASKRKCVLALLWVLGVWPLAHRYLVQRFEVNPWRFFGWAMYCTPALAPRVEVWLDTAEARVALDTAADPELERLIASFERQRLAWGELRRPDDIGRRVLDQQPQATRVEVEVVTRRLDPSRASIRARSRLYAYTP